MKTLDLLLMKYEPIVTKDVLAKILCRHVKTIEEGLRQNKFPFKPIQISKKRNLFKLDEIAAYLDNSRKNEKTKLNDENHKFLLAHAENL